MVSLFSLQLFSLFIQFYSLQEPCPGLIPCPMEEDEQCKVIKLFRKVIIFSDNIQNAGMVINLGVEQEQELLEKRVNSSLHEIVETLAKV